MPPEGRDPSYLWDMLNAARSIERMLQGVTLEQFLADEMRRLAVERLLEIIGEAGRRVGKSFQDAHPEIPWRDIIALRNVVAHEYDRIDYDEIWAIASGDMPKLALSLALLVKEPEKDVGG